MSLPKSKMISASKAIMALAAKGKYQMDDSVRAIQNQTVTVNVQQHPSVTANSTPASVIFLQLLTKKSSSNLLYSVCTPIPI